MKLLKKLLPVATIASVAAVVAPLVTSCNKAKENGGAGICFTLTQETDLDAFYVDRLPIPEDIDDLTENDIWKLYYEKINGNKQILASDFVQHYALIQGPGEGKLPTELNQMDITIEDVDQKNTAVSYNIKYDWDEKSTSAQNDHIFYIDVKNLQFQIHFTGSSWQLQAYGFTFSNDPDEIINFLKTCTVDWAITIQYGKPSVSWIKREICISKESSYEELSNFIQQLQSAEFIQYQSMFLSESDYLKDIDIW